MTTAIRALLAPAPSGLSGLAARIGATVERFRRVRANRRAMRDLLELNDHLLGDIGLSHGEVESALTAAWSADPSTGAGRHARLRG